LSIRQSFLVIVIAKNSIVIPKMSIIIPKMGIVICKMSIAILKISITIVEISILICKKDITKKVLNTIILFIHFQKQAKNQIMKKIFYLMISFAAIFTSCDNQIPEVIHNPPVEHKPGDGEAAKLEFYQDTVTYVPYQSEFLKDSIWSDGITHSSFFKANEAYFSILDKPYYIGQILTNSKGGASILSNLLIKDSLQIFSFDNVSDFDNNPPKIKAGDNIAIDNFVKDFIKNANLSNSVTFGYNSTSFRSMKQLYVDYAYKVRDLDKMVSGKKYFEHKADTIQGYVYSLEQVLRTLSLDMPLRKIVKIPKGDFAITGMAIGRDALLVMQTKMQKSDANRIINTLLDNKPLVEKDKRLLEQSTLQYIDPSKGVLAEGQMAPSIMMKAFSSRESVRPLYLEGVIGRDYSYSANGYPFHYKVELKEVKRK